MMFRLYNLLSAISLLLYLPWLLFKKGPEEKVKYLGERLGTSRYTSTDIWVHAVSVGEVMACLPFLKTLKKEFPDKKIIFSTTTYTGQKIAQERFSEANRIMYMPWDTGLCVSRVVRLLRPKIFITIETELWPILFQTLKNMGSYIILLNGRISQDSFKGYKRLRLLMKKVLSHVDFLYMQGKTDVEKIIAIGADEKRVGVMGNFKFDIEFDKRGSLQWMDCLKGQILLAGSTHRGEEEIILDAYELIKKESVQNPVPDVVQGNTEHRAQTKDYKGQESGVRDQAYDLKLILAPRHPERFGEVENILKERGLGYVRRSEIKETQSPVPCSPAQSTNRTLYQMVQSRAQNIDNNSQEISNSRPADVILLDTIGELPQVFSKVTITFIGGSLLPFGGHNILEPAYWSKPIIFGPHMDNFPIAKEFLDNSAALQAKDSQEIAKTVKELLENTDKARYIGQNARAIIENNAGAVKKAIELIRGFIGTT